MSWTNSERLRGDRGAASSLAVALLTPIFMFLMFAAVQAALWSHARTEARVIARDTAARVARSDMSATDAAAAARAVLDADTDLTNVSVEFDATTDIVAVTIEADAPGMLRGTYRNVIVTVALPREQLSAR